MKTQGQIVEYYRHNKEEDFLGFAGEVLLCYLDFDHAKEFLKPKTYSDEWNTDVYPLTREKLLADIKDYMAFAWGKVENHRGISASRSVEKMEAWLWLLEDEKTLSFAKNEANYKNYGAPVLKKICEVYGFAIPDSKEIQNMTRGERCCVDCDEGCGE